MRMRTKRDRKRRKKKERKSSKDKDRKRDIDKKGLVISFEYIIFKRNKSLHQKIICKYITKTKK